MKSRRTAKVAQAILETVSSTILFGLKDPRVKRVTVLSVDVSPDIRTAKVAVSIMGDEKEQALCLHGLNSARGYIQAKCADRLQTRYTPVLTFVIDDSVKKSAETARILNEVLPSTDVSDAEAAPVEDSSAADNATDQNAPDPRSQPGDASSLDRPAEH
jgi:ribosome-binding factor A